MVLQDTQSTTSPTQRLRVRKWFSLCYKHIHTAKEVFLLFLTMLEFAQVNSHPHSFWSNLHVCFLHNKARQGTGLCPHGCLSPAGCTADRVPPSWIWALTAQPPHLGVPTCQHCLCFQPKRGRTHRVCCPANRFEFYRQQASSYSYKSNFNSDYVS